MKSLRKAIYRSLAVASACGLFVATSMSAEMHAPESILQPEDIFALEYANDPQVSPDGETIAYVRTSMDIMTDKARKAIWLSDLDGDAHRPLLASRANFTSPRWSPRGDRLAYVSNSEGSNQIYVKWLATGDTALVSNLSKSPSHVTWSPDGRWLAFLMFVPEVMVPLASMPAKPKNADWADPVKQIEALTYRSDGEGFLEQGQRQLFIIPAEGGTPRQLTHGAYAASGRLNWSKDGARIYFVSHRVADWEYEPGESDIYSVVLASGEITRHTDRVGPDTNPSLSPNGRYLAYTGHAARATGYNNSELYVLDLESGASRKLSDDFDRSIENPQWDSSGTSIWFQYEDRGTYRIASSNLKGKLAESDLRLGGTTLGRPYASGSFDIGANGVIAFTAGDTQSPADLMTSRRGEQPRQLTQLNKDLLAHKTLANVQEITWESSFDGQEIQGWLMTPPGFDAQQRYPLILEIHGGPHAAYGPNFSAEAQLFAAQGYVVLYTNPRGSTSYGDAFANAIHLAYPGNDYDDLMSGVDAVIERGFVDPEQLFVTGGSGGGVLTAWIVGKTDRFKAAVVAKPVINWISFALTADYALYFSTFWFDGPAWEKTEDYWARSPLSLVGNVSTPTMLLTGEADYRTPMSETEQYYQALKQRKVDTMMIRIPGAPHGIAGRPSRLIAKVNNILAWFERYRPASP